MVSGQDEGGHWQAIQLFYYKANQIVANPIVIKEVTSNYD